MDDEGGEDERLKHVGDEVLTLKLVWHPAQMKGRRVLGGAFSKRDLKPEADEAGKPRYVSTDRRDMLSRESVDGVIAGQQSDGKKEQLRRHDAFFTEYLTERLRALRDKEGYQPFEVMPEPIMPGNPGHCGIHNISPAERNTDEEHDEYVQQLRKLLLKDCQHTVYSYAEVFGAEPAAADRK